MLRFDNDYTQGGLPGGAGRPGAHQLGADRRLWKGRVLPAGGGADPQPLPGAGSPRALFDRRHPDEPNPDRGGAAPHQGVLLRRQRAHPDPRDRRGGGHGHR